MNQFSTNIKTKMQDVSSCFQIVVKKDVSENLSLFTRKEMAKWHRVTNFLGPNSPLSFVDYTEIKELPHYWASLSHSKSKKSEDNYTAIAMALAQKTVWGGIGIDVEFANRPMNLESERHFINSHDHNTQQLITGFREKSFAPQLVTWCKKEAAFKSMRQIQLSFLKQFQRPLVLKDIWISGNYFGLIQSPDHIQGIVSAQKIERQVPLILGHAHLYPFPLPKR